MSSSCEIARLIFEALAHSARTAQHIQTVGRHIGQRRGLVIQRRCRERTQIAVVALPLRVAPPSVAGSQGTRNWPSFMTSILAATQKSHGFSASRRR